MSTTEKKTMSFYIQHVKKDLTPRFFSHLKMEIVIMVNK
jgi:hypothetical protein